MVFILSSVNVMYHFCSLTFADLFPHAREKSHLDWVNELPDVLLDLIG